MEPELNKTCKDISTPNDTSQCNGSPRAKATTNGHLTMSYYHNVDEAYPLSTLTLPQLFERQAKLDTGAGITWHRPSERITFTQLYMKGMRLAKGLLAIGLKRGDVAMSTGVEGADGVILFVAASAIGVGYSAPYIYSPIRKNVALFVKKLNPKLILLGHTVTGANLEDPFADVLQSLDELAQSAEFEMPTLYRDKHSEDMEVTDLVGNRLNTVLPLEELCKLGESISDEELEKCKSVVSLNEACFYAFSSGSTGDSKTVVLGAASLTNGGIQKQERYGTNTESRYACRSMCSEDLCLIDEVVSAAYTGNKVTIVPGPITWDCEKVCREMLEIFEKDRIQSVYADQYFLTYIVNHPDITKGYDLSSWTSIILAGSGSSPGFKKSVLELFPDSVDAYGLSEHYSAASSISGMRRDKLNFVGKVTVNEEAKVVDDNGNCLPIKTQGELWLRGYCNMLEYKDQPELTKSAITEDGWFKTGDCVIMDEEGDIQIVGRLSTTERFKVFCDVVYAQNVERAMKNCKHIKEIAVIGRLTGTTVGHELSYCIILREKDSLTVQQVYEYAQELVECSNEWPIRIFFYENFPLQGYRHKIGRKAITKEITEKVEKDFYVNLCDKSYQR